VILEFMKLKNILAIRNWRLAFVGKWACTSRLCYRYFFIWGDM